MALRSSKEVDNKVSEKEHDKDERLKIIKSDLKIEKENDSSLSPIMSNPLLHLSQGFIALKLQIHHSLPTKISRGMTS